MGGLLAGTMLVAGSVGASANFAFCSSDPPIVVITPGGHSVTVNTQVILPAGSQQLKNDTAEDAVARPDGHGGTLITVNVYVAAPAHVVSSVYRYKVSTAGDGRDVVTLQLDVPIS